MDFGELENDQAFVEKVSNLSNSIDIISEHIKAACDFPNYEELATEDKVKFDLYLSYSINSLFWMLCKLQAIDTNEVRGVFCVHKNPFSVSFGRKIF